jgi:hypothetical protein
MSENDEKQKNDEMLQFANKMRSEYKAAEVDEEEQEMEFLDKLNRLVQIIVNDDSFSMYSNLSESSLKRWHGKRFSRALKRLFSFNTKNLLYFTLLATITGFLVSEATSFYAIDGMVSAGTYVKAILTEICFIFLSGYRSTDKLTAVWASFLRVGIFCLMMFVITSQAFDTGIGKVSENENIQQQVVLLEEQIKQKEKDIAYFKEINWPKNAARTTIEKQELVQKLINLKDQQASGKNKDVSEREVYKMYGRAIFRVLLLFISVLITRRLFTF